MPRLSSHVRLIASLIAAWAPFSSPVFAQTAAPSHDAAPALQVEGMGEAVSLNGAWQFHLGDDMAWASATVDDATGHNGWEQVFLGSSSARASDSRGVFLRPFASVPPHYVGYSWCRRRIAIAPAGAPPRDLAVLLAQVPGAYELYWNGVRIGSRGRLPPRPTGYNSVLPSTFGLGKTREGVLALRIWTPPDVSGYGTASTTSLGRIQSYIGSGTSIATLESAIHYQWILTRQYHFSLALLRAVFGFICLLGWWRNRREPLLLWTAAYCFAFLYSSIASDLWLNWQTQNLWSSTASSCLSITGLFLLLHLLRLRGRRILYRIVIVGLVYAVIDLALRNSIWVTVDWSNSISPFWQRFFGRDNVFAMDLAIVLPFVVFGSGLTKRQDPTHLLFAATVACSKLINYLPVLFGITWAQDTLFTINGSPFTPTILINTLLLILVIVAVYRHQREAARRQDMIEQELQNARAVQQVLIPEAIPTVPGFAIQSVYKPAGEVGGDFFQILPTQNGGLLAVIGDVSGKGMPAAMAVSLLVGTVRTLARYTQNPGEILAAMNMRMLARSKGGFTTCLVLRFDADGTLTAANAGHLAPYLDGCELALENGLPLGLAAETVYPESRFALPESKQLTLITDGVVEARSKRGALFGFEQAAAISTASAESIALTAQSFGQEDDITVLTFMRVSVSAHPDMPLTTPALATNG